MTDSVEVPPGLDWTADKAKKALKNDVYVYIQPADKEATNNTTFRKLTGAQREWRNGNNNYIVVNDDNYRVCGDRSQIEKVFKLNGVDLSVLNSSAVITSANADFVQEQKDEEQKESRQERMSKYTPPQIVQFYLHHKSLKHNSDYVAEQKEEPASPTGRKKSPLRGKAKTSLSEKYNDLKDGEYLDISNMTDTGAKTSVVSAPGPKSKKQVSDKFVTNKVDRYVKALELLGLSKSDYAGNISALTDSLLPEIAQMAADGATPAPGTPKAKTPSPKRSPSPKRLPVSKKPQVRKK
jgi:hypothetical protein